MSAKAFGSVALGVVLMSVAGTVAAQGVRFGIGGGPTFSLEEGGGTDFHAMATLGLGRSGDKPLGFRIDGMLQFLENGESFIGSGNLVYAFRVSPPEQEVARSSRADWDNPGDKRPGARESGREDLGNQIGNHNQEISRRTVAHYGASSLGKSGFSGGASELIMPGSRVRVPPLLLTSQSLIGSTSSGFSTMAPLAEAGRCHFSWSRAAATRSHRSRSSVSALKRP